MPQTRRKQRPAMPPPVELEEELATEVAGELKEVAEKHLEELREKLKSVEGQIKQLEKERWILSTLIYRYSLITGRALPRITQAMAKIMEEKGEPMSIKELQEKLLEMGYPVTSVGGVHSISSILATSKYFVPVRRGVWRLASPEEREQRAEELRARWRRVKRGY